MKSDAAKKGIERAPHRALFKAIGYISPEAAQGGTIAIVNEGDPIVIDIPAKTLSLKVSDGEIKQRMAGWQAPEPKIRNGYMALYARQVSSASQGAVVK